MASKSKAVNAANEIYAILEPLDHGDRTKAIRAALVLLGDSADFASEVSGGDSGPGSGATGRLQRQNETEKAYFDSKEPRTKGEELAVAARYREELKHATSSTRAEIESVIRAARRNFDGGNFRRDLDNARRKGLFNSGTGKDSIILSYYGQQYVDALPDRDGVKGVRRPKRRGNAKKRRAVRPAKKK